MAFSSRRGSGLGSHGFIFIYDIMGFRLVLMQEG